MACVKRIQNNMLYQKSVHTSRPHTYWQGRRSWGGGGYFINLRTFQGQGFASIPDKFGGNRVPPPTCSRFWRPCDATTTLPPPVPTSLIWPNMQPTFSFLIHSLAKMSDVTYRIYTLCARMEILAWFLPEGKYYSHTWFLHTTWLLRYQGPPEN